MNLVFKRNGVLLLVLVLLTSLILPMTTSAAPETKHQGKGNGKNSNIQSYVSDMQPGWNLGNTFDATGDDETSWGNPRVTKELINGIADQGYKSIRIPITWDQRIGVGPDYKIDPAFMNRVQEVVDWSLDAGLYVMINIHHDSWIWVNQMGSDHDEVLARYESAWTQIANRFKNHPNKLMFESVNEPRFTDGWGDVSEDHFEMLNELNTSFHKIVRDSGAKNVKRPLVLPTLETASAQENLDDLYKTIVSLNDPNLIATVHYYGYWPFSVNVAGFTKFNEETKNDIINTFDRVHHTFVAKGIPVILGEYGLLGFDKNTETIEQGEKLKFFEFLNYYVQEKEITHMLWDNGQHFNRQTYQWADSELYNLMNTSLKQRSATAETDLIFLKQDADVEDVSIKLNLNNNRLTGIKADHKKLHKKKVYEINGDVLTLNATLLKKLTSSGTLGQNGELIAEFNKGVDWRLDVILYDTPTLESVNGTTDSYAIPTEFNGDRLATMEAVYADDGSNAGPQNWTSFKEFAYAFTPSYDTNEMKLLPAFFNEVRDGEVLLKFHFWSGEVVTYKITKTGSIISGVAL